MVCCHPGVYASGFLKSVLNKTQNVKQNKRKSRINLDILCAHKVVSQRKVLLCETFFFFTQDIKNVDSPQNVVCTYKILCVMYTLNFYSGFLNL
jgi:hypothetical protein